MAIQIQGTNSVNVQADSFMGSMRVSTVPRGDGYALSSVTGTIAAAATANSCFFAMRTNPGASKNAYITQLRIQYTTIVVYTTPVTAGRRLAVYRGSAAAASGGTALATAAQMLTTSPTSIVNSANSGDARIASTGGLTVTGITFETQELETFYLTGYGAAGATANFERRYDQAGSSPIILTPGQLIAIRNPAAMDAAGTWQIGVDIEWYEF